MLLQGRKRFRKATRLSSNRYLKHPGSFYYLHRLTVTWESRETQSGEAKALVLQVCLRCSSIPDFTKHQMWLTKPPAFLHRPILRDGPEDFRMNYVLQTPRVEKEVQSTYTLHSEISQDDALAQPDWVTTWKGQCRQSVAPHTWGWLEALVLLQRWIRPGLDLIVKWETWMPR